MIYQRLFGAFGEERADARAALMPWLYACAHKRPGHAMPKIEQFMPQFQGTKPRRTPQQIETAAFRWLNAHNAMVDRQQQRRGALPSP